MVKEKTEPSGLPEKRGTDQLAGAQGKDFSGLEFLELSLEGQNFFESIFNGCLLEGVRASQSIFQHAEFTETKLSNCIFEDTSFDHSDFVLTSISGTEFIRCSFQNAEWRDAEFDKVTFRQCIFRNTTTSLTRFRHCSFDDSSAASFVGASKRFSLISQTIFRLPLQYIHFLRHNFGIKSHETPAAAASGLQDPLFKLSLMYYSGDLTPQQFYHLILEALSQMAENNQGPKRLRTRYISGICKLLLEEQFLSVFAIQLLESELSKIASAAQDGDQALELIGLILPLRVALRERVMAVDEEVSEFLEFPPSKLRLQFDFEETYQLEVIDEYMEQLAAYCGLSRNAVTIGSIRPGSTFVEAVIAAAVFVPDIVRFIKYSLSFVTVSLTQTVKIRDAYRNLTSGKTKPAKTLKASKSISQSGTRARKSQKGMPSVSIAKEITGDKLESAKPVEIFVDMAREKVLVVGGKVRVTISGI
jgi:hypothetical protein